MKKRLLALAVCTFLLAVLLLPIGASANSAAPDPVATVKLKNLPNGAYTVSLTDDKGKSFTDGEPSGAEAFRFHGYHLPKAFTVTLTDEDGTQVVSPIYQRQSYYTTLVFDCATGRITYATPVWLAYIIQFLCTCIPTLLIEGGILLLFRFDWRKNWRLFLCVNLATQIFLTWCMAGTFIGNGSRGYPVFLLIFAEVPIFLVECLVYGKWLKGRTLGARAGYALTANLASLFFGVAVNAPLFSLLQRL